MNKRNKEMHIKKVSEQEINTLYPSFINALKKVCYTGEDATYSLIEFFKSQEQHLDYDTFIEIQTLKNKLLKQKAKENKTPFKEIKTPPFFVAGFLIFSYNKTLYRFYLDKKTPYFHAKNEKKDYYPAAQEVFTALKHAVRKSSFTGTELQTILSFLYPKRQTNLAHLGLKIPTRPSFNQLITKNNLLKELGLTKSDDIMPTLCGPREICARINGRCIQIILDETNPIARVLERNTIRPLLIAEFKKIYALLCKDIPHYHKIYRQFPLRQIKKRLMEKLPTHHICINNLFEKKHTDLKRKKERQDMRLPSIDFKTISNLPTADEEKTISETSFFEQTLKNTGLDLTPLYDLFITPEPKESDLLQDIQIPKPICVELPEYISKTPFTSGFLSRENPKPSFDHLYNTIFTISQIHQQRYKTDKNLLPNIDIPPVLCHDNCLYYKKGVMLCKISLNEDKPLFKIVDILSKKTARMLFKDVKSVISLWLKDNPKAADTLTNKLFQLYQKTTGNELHQATRFLPTIQDIYTYYSYKTMLDNVKNNTKSDVNIPPYILAPNMLYAKMGPLHLKITVKDNILFEKHFNGQTYLMTINDLNRFLNQAMQNKTLFSKTGALLRDVYMLTHMPFFKNKTDRVTILDAQQTLKQKFQFPHNTLSRGNE